MSGGFDLMEIGSSEIYQWHKLKLEEMIQGLELYEEDIGVSQVIYLKQKITAIIDMLLLLTKHLDYILYEMKEQKK